jgi:hypothetical protein
MPATGAPRKPRFGTMSRHVSIVAALVPCGIGDAVAVP